MLTVIPALEALQILSPTTYAWLGEPVDVETRWTALAPPEARRGALTRSIGNRLYDDFFTVGGPSRPGDRAPAGPRRGRLSHALGAANAGEGSFDRGWRLVAREGSKVVVERNRLRLWVDEADIGWPSEVGIHDAHAVAVRWPKGASAIAPGFYIANGDESLAAPRPQPLDRFYIHIACAGAIELMGLATVRLNDAALPFRLKIVDDPDGFDRCDTAVFAFQRRDRQQAYAHVRDIHREMTRHIDDATPSIARRLAPGLAFAEDPGNARSFGAHRCDVLAEAMVAAFERSSGRLEERVAVARHHFEQAGVNPDHPHLGLDSPGDLATELPSIAHGGAPCR